MFLNKASKARITASRDSIMVSLLRAAPVMMESCERNCLEILGLRCIAN